MDIGVEISLYPLNSDFVAPIRAFIARLNDDPRLKVVTNSLSTQLFGAYEDVMEALRRELRDRKSTRLNSSHSQISYAVFCLKKKNRTHRVSAHRSRSATRPLT